MTLDPRSYQRATEPAPSEVDALVEAVESELDGPRVSVVRRAAPWVAVAAAALLAAWWATRPDTMEVALRSDAETHLAGSGWEVVHNGEGHLLAEADDVGVDWDRGRLVVEVQPGQGLTFVVRTEEAEVAVVGTGFVVERDAGGTAVEVVHGVVRTTCEGEVVELHAGASRRCWPTTAAGRLDRARALRAGGAAPEQVLGAVDQGLAAQPSDVVAGELAALGVDVAYVAERWDEVVTRGQPWLDAQGPRRWEIAERVALAQVRLGGCDAARPLLRRLVEERGTPEDVRRAERCP